MVLKEIREAQSVSFTTDIWTSGQMVAYMTVTAHLISNDWEMRSFVLETRQMDESHTAVNIAERLGEVRHSITDS